jgi:hypothetical protein
VIRKDWWYNTIQALLQKIAKEVTNDETPPNFIKRKHSRKGERKRNKGQRPKSRQANSPKETSHKEERESLRTKPSNWVNQ